MPQVEARRPSLEILDVSGVPSQKNGSADGGNADTDVDPMSLVVTRSVVETVIKAQDPSLTLVDFTAKPGSNIGDNYMSIMYAVAANVTKPGSKGVETRHVMLKTMPLNAMRQQMANDAKVFVKESLVYGTLFRDLEKFQEERGLSSNEIYRDYPACYATFVDGKSDFLAMENLITSGHKMADRTKGLDRTHANLVMKSLARLHAVAYVKFRGNFQAILDKYPGLEDSFWCVQNQPEMSAMFVGQSIKNAITSLRAGGYEAEATILEGPQFETARVLKVMDKLIAQPCKHAIIGHGDAWTNNMMFKYDEVTGQPTAVKLYDFQISRPCSRTLDLLYFLNGCLQEDLVHKTETEFLKVYYDEFASFAKRLGFFEPELTFEQLLAEFDEYRAFGIVIGLIAIPFFYANKADVKNMEELPGEMSEDTVKEFIGGMLNSIAVKRMSELINVGLPKVKDL